MIDATETPLALDSTTDGSVTLETDAEKIDRLSREVAALTAQQSAIFELLESVRDEVSPFLKRLENSPVIKMLGL